jgi:hypothetical protein
MTSELKVKKSEALNHSELKTSKPKVNIKPQSRITQAQDLNAIPRRMRSWNNSKADLVTKTLIYSRAKSKSQSKSKTFSTCSDDSRTSAKPYKQRKFKEMRTNHKGPMKIWAPKSEIIYVSDMHSKKTKATILVSGQWLLTSHDRRKVYVPKPDSPRGRFCGVWRQTKRQDHWDLYSW